MSVYLVACDIVDDEEDICRDKFLVYLDKLRQEFESKGTGDTTFLIDCGDHHVADELNALINDAFNRILKKLHNENKCRDTWLRMYIAGWTVNDCALTGRDSEDIKAWLNEPQPIGMA